MGIACNQAGNLRYLISSQNMLGFIDGVLKIRRLPLNIP